MREAKTAPEEGRKDKTGQDSVIKTRTHSSRDGGNKFPQLGRLTEVHTEVCRNRHVGARRLVLADLPQIVRLFDYCLYVCKDVLQSVMYCLSII